MSISILLADDSITIQKVIGIIFGGEDYTLTVVDNGKAAVDKAVEVNPDVLMIDAMMPDMSGYEVCETLRANPALSQKPVLLLTGSFEPFDEEKAKSCGADDVLSKPFESQQIISKVKALYELGSSRAQSQTPLVQVSSVAPVEAVVAQPAVEEPFAAVQPAANDIWGAFTPPVEEVAEAPLQEPPSIPESAVFQTVDESAFNVEPAAAISAEENPAQIGSQWIPTEEQTFEFEEEQVAEPPADAFAPQGTPAASLQEFDESSFADVDEPGTIATPAFSAPAADVDTPAATFSVAAMPNILESIPSFDDAAQSGFVRSAAMSAPHPGPAVETPVFETVSSFSEPAIVAASAVEAPQSVVPAAISEEQLRAAIASVSKDVIEKIVWEVVPDLAESMIREAIRRIKEGQ